MPQDKDLVIIDLTELFSAPSILLVGEPLSGIHSVEEYIRSINPTGKITIAYDRNITTIYGMADVILEVVQQVMGSRVERHMIIQKWKGHEVPETILPFIIKPNKIEPDTKERVG
jgi:ABC-type sugar transport system ATPase subunit